MLLALLVSSSLSFVPGDSLEAGPPPQIITAAMIREAGLVRPSDLFYLIDGWGYASLDGFHYQASAGWLSPVPDTWALRIDDQPVPASLGGVQDLNLIPVALEDVAYVEVYTRPVLVQGTFAGRGLIHIHTRQRSGGFGANAGYWQGNETGDPGPLRYLGQTGNVDKLGPDLSASAYGGAGRVDAQVSALSRDHHPTDAAILPRILPLSSVWPNMVVRGGSGQVTFTGLGGEHTTSGYVTRAADYLWIQPYGRAFPANQEWSAGNLSGDIALTPQLRFHHTLGFSSSALRQRTNPLGLDPDWHRAVWFGRAEVAHTGGTLAATLGAKLEREQVRSAWLPGMQTDTWPTVYARVASAAAGRFAYSLAGSATMREDISTWGILSSAALQGTGRQRLDATLTLSQGAVRDENPLWYRVGRGYAFIDSLGITYAPLDALQQSTSASADLNWGYQRDGLRMGAGLLYRWSTGLLLDRQALSAELSDPVYVGSVHFTADAGGHMAGGRFHVHNTVLPYVSQRSSITARLGVYGDAAFEEAWRRWPAVTARTSWTYAPASSFSLNTRLAYQSGAAWRLTATEAEGGPVVEVGPKWLLDLSAQKWVWNRRIRGSIIVRNALNRRFRYHPRGETRDLSLILHLSIHLNDP